MNQLEIKARTRATKAHTRAIKAHTRALTIRFATKILAGALLAALAPIGCGGDGTTTGSGGSGGSGASSNSSSSSGPGGNGGTGGSGGTGGGPVVTCLDPSDYAALFTITGDALCAVAVYDADEALGFQAPSWGTHDGPLTVRTGASGSVDLVRWTPPAGAKGALTKKVTHVDSMLPDGSFASAQAVDLPFFGWTVLSWSGAFPDTAGEILAIDGTTVAKRFPTNGAFAFAGVGTDGASGRLLHTGLSQVGITTAGNNGLFAADACETGPMEDLFPGGNPACKAPITVSEWGDASGAVAVDAAGNAFAMASSFATSDQEARGFAAPLVARGAAPTDGAVMFTLPGFGSSLAALAPKGAVKGLLAFQPFDGTTFDALDVVGLAYTASASAVTPDGAPTKLLQLTTTNTSLYLVTDRDDRLWVAGAGGSGTTYVVLARKP